MHTFNFVYSAYFLKVIQVRTALNF